MGRVAVAMEAIESWDGVQKKMEEDLEVASLRVYGLTNLLKSSFKPELIEVKSILSNVWHGERTDQI